MAVLHVKSPNGTTYNMTIVTSGVTESLQPNGWCKLPNGLLIQWLAFTGTKNSAGYDWRIESGQIRQLSTSVQLTLPLAHHYLAFSVTAEDSDIGMCESCSSYAVTDSSELTNRCIFMYNKSLGTDADNTTPSTYGAQIITIGFS